jgi:hypothetical protein
MMGIDNNGILFLGLPDHELDISVLDLNPAAIEENGIEEALWEWRLADKNRLQIEAQPDSRYDRRMILIGFKLADSGSYGCKEVEEFQEKLNKSKEQFIKLFQKIPKIWILNYQW